MAYSAMVWLDDPGEYPQEENEEAQASSGCESAPGGATGVNVEHALLQLIYGVYENQGAAGDALAEMLDNLWRNAFLRTNKHGKRMFLVPAVGGTLRRLRRGGASHEPGLASAVPPAVERRRKPEASSG